MDLTKKRPTQGPAGRLVAIILAVPVVLGLPVAPAPAGAESVTVTDPVGDADGYDISTMRVRHLAKRVTFELRQENTPYWYEIRVDTPGPKKVHDYVVMWSVYAPRKAFVHTRRGFENDGKPVCVRRSAKVAEDNSVLRFSVPRRCFGPPKSLRVKAIAWDDQSGWMDRTRWTEWAGVA